MTRSNLNNGWRRVAASVYRKPVDSKIFGSVEIDVTDLEAFISARRKQGVKITLTHFFTLAVARALKNDVPELNCLRVSLTEACLNLVRHPTIQLLQKTYL